MPIINGIRMKENLWEHCPSCDAILSDRIAIGDEWECESCGEYGTRRPGKHDFSPLVPIFPTDLKTA
jgi:ribosomal protein L37AE/L43A